MWNLKTTTTTKKTEVGKAEQNGSYQELGVAIGEMLFRVQFATVDK